MNKSADETYFHGLERFNAGDLDGALSVWAALVHECPTAATWRAIASIWFQRDDRAKGKECLLNALSLSGGPGEVVGDTAWGASMWDIGANGVGNAAIGAGKERGPTVPAAF